MTGEKFDLVGDYRLVGWAVIDVEMIDTRIDAKLAFWCAARGINGRPRFGNLIVAGDANKPGTVNGGISFGGVIAFIFADLIVLPVLNIYRKYYGLKMTGFLFATFYASMATAALIVEFAFGALGLVPQQRHAQVVEASIGWNYTTFLNIGFLVLAAALIGRFLKTGGPKMLNMMNGSAAGAAH